MRYNYNYVKVYGEGLKILRFLFFFHILKFLLLKLSSFQKRRANFYVWGVFFVLFCLVYVWGFLSRKKKPDSNWSFLLSLSVCTVGHGSYSRSLLTCLLSGDG